MAGAEQNGLGIPKTNYMGFVKFLQALDEYCLWIYFYRFYCLIVTIDNITLLSLQLKLSLKDVYFLRSFLE